LSMAEDVRPNITSSAGAALFGPRNESLMITNVAVLGVLVVIRFSIP